MSLLTEIVELIVEAFISAQHTVAEIPSQIEFIPQWYLTPLLRVCRLWHVVAERYLYRSIAIGNKIPPSMNTDNFFHGYYLYLFKRDGHKIAQDLLTTLVASPRLAALVRTLRLGIHFNFDYGDRQMRTLKLERTQTYNRILRLCRNAENVEIRGFEYSGKKRNALVNVLKEMSLVTFCISSRLLSSPGVTSPGRKERFRRVLNLMRRWPRLRSIRVEEFLTDEAKEYPTALEAPQPSECCPYLQEISFPDDSLHDFEFRALRSMCSGVTKLSVSLYGKRVGERGDVAIDGLCDCLRAWSSTLQHLDLEVLDHRNASQPLAEVIGGLRSLRELQTTKLKLKLAPISQLPRLEYFASLSFYDRDELGILLEDPSRFPSLNFLAYELDMSYDYDYAKLSVICARRNILLS